LLPCVSCYQIPQGSCYYIVVPAASAAAAADDDDDKDNDNNDGRCECPILLLRIPMGT
jgi:hypothetical protein